MKPTTPELQDPHDTQELTEHLEWLRRLARSLVRDPEVADDLTHETLVAALRARGERPRSLRNWLASVLRRQAADRMRRESRLEDRERMVARPDVTGSPLEELERGSVQAVVAEEVGNLPQAYREVLLWRYFDDLTPTQIASDHDIPVSTVKTRLQRGLAQLRERLDARHGGDGRSWVAALAPLVLPARRAVPASALTAAGVLIAAAAVSFTLWKGLGADVALPAASPSRGAQTPVVAGEPDLDRAGDGPGRETAAPVEASPDRDPLAGLPPMRSTSELVTGRVVDAQGRGVAGVPILFESWNIKASGAPVNVSGKDGAFSLRGAGGRGLLRAVGARATLAAAKVEGDRRTGLTVVVAPRRRLSGRVLDAAGEPLPGARVEWLAPPPRLPALTLPLPHLVEAALDGSYSLDGPAGPGARLVISASGYLTREVDLPADDRDDLDLALESDSTRAVATGQVVDAAGQPVAGARLGLEREQALAGADGRFRIALPEGDGPWVLRALVEGRQPGSSTGARVDDVLRWDGEEGPLRLVLGGAPLTLIGRVVDGTGQPLAGVRVWLDDPTTLRLPRRREGIGFERSNQLPGELHPDEAALFVEASLAGAKDDDGWRPVITAADGGFKLEGLCDRPYVVGLMHPTTLQRSHVEDVRAGSEPVELTLTNAPVWPRVAGRLVDPQGAPVSSADVMLAVTAIEIPTPGGSNLRTTTTGSCQFTGERGSFVFTDVPRAGTWLRVVGRDLLPTMVPLSELAERKGVDLSNLEVEVVPLGRFQVAGAGGLGADAVAAVDAEDVRVPLHRVQGGRRELVETARLEDGSSSVLQVPRTVTELVLLAGEREVLRVPVRFVDGAVLVVRP